MNQGFRQWARSATARALSWGGERPDRVIRRGARGRSERIWLRGRPYLKKVFHDDVEGRAAMRAELRAAEVFGELRWMSPLLESESMWLRRRWFEPQERLDVAVQNASEDVREEMAFQAVGALFDMFRRGYAHRDFHARNLFWTEGTLKVIDFECLGEYGNGARPAFPESYDLTGRGLTSPHRTDNMCYLGGHPTGSALEDVLGVPLEIPLRRLEDTLRSRLLSASLDFATANGRHACRAQRIYGAFSTPYFSVESAVAQRDSARRLARFAVTADALRGRRLLDLGCHAGALVLEAQKLEPAYSLGIEHDAEKVDVARDIAAYSGLEGVEFRQADIDLLDAESLGTPFDVVFCCAIDAHVEDRERLYGLLGAVAAETLCFEGNSSTDVDAVAAALTSHGFNQVSRLGLCDDDCLEANNCRPILVARK